MFESYSEYLYYLDVFILLMCINIAVGETNMENIVSRAGLEPTSYPPRIVSLLMLAITHNGLIYTYIG